MLVAAIVAVICLSASLGAADANPAHQQQSAELTHSPDVHLNPDLELRLVHTVFRHGPRTPADTYPKDPHVNESFYPYGWGHLTNDGKKYMFESGEWLRQRYGQFLGELYVPDAVWAQTTGVTRTKMSMAAVLAGLFPPKDTALEWNRKLNWQPIPIFSEPLDEDTLLLVRTPCPRYYEAVDEVFATAELQKVLSDNEQLLAELSNHTGMPIKTPDDVQSLYSTLRAESEYGLNLPDWTATYHPQRLESLTELSYIYNVYTDELKRLKAGPFWRKMIGEWQSKVTATIRPTDAKIYLYTGHDSTIVNVLAAVGVWQQQLPVYGIMGIFELLQDRSSGEWGVQMYLRTSAKSGAIPLTIPGCEHFCPLNKVVDLVEHITKTLDESECLAKNVNFMPPPASGP